MNSIKMLLAMLAAAVLLSGCYVHPPYHHPNNPGHKGPQGPEQQN